MYLKLQLTFLSLLGRGPYSNNKHSRYGVYLVR